ncbi:MAG: OmpA family protein [Novosphingobium sp.]|nr:OmpA family protein [Novosphingobium sp.]
MTIKLFLAAGALLASTSAWAQSSPATEQTADDLVCQLSGDCADLAETEATRDKPESRGFKLARKSTASESKAGSSPAKSARESAKVATERKAPAGAASNPGTRARKMAAATRPATGRADLRVSFVTGSAELTDAGRREADKFITALTAASLSGKKFRIEGHTDSVGSRDFNVELSKRRAQAVVDYLASKGAERTRFAVAGYGFDKPIAGTSASNGENRRVEVVLVK